MEKSFASRLMSVINEIPSLKKDVQGYGYKYTNLDTIFSVIKPILAKHQMGFYQAVTSTEGVTGVETVIFDVDGNSISSFTPLPDTTVKGANNAQNMGASITYIKRYAISALLDISSDEDTDGLTNEDIIKKSNGTSNSSRNYKRASKQPQQNQREQVLQTQQQQAQQPANKNAPTVSAPVDVVKIQDIDNKVIVPKPTPAEKLDYIYKKYNLWTRPEIQSVVTSALKDGTDEEILSVLERCEKFLIACDISKENIYD